MTKSGVKTSLFGFLTGARINLGGQLFGSELFALLFFPFRFIGDLYLKSKDFRIITLLYIPLLLGLIISDTYNGTSTFDFIRGWLNPVFSYISFVFLLNVLSKNRDNIFSYMLAISFSMLLFGNEIDSEMLAVDSNYYKVSIVPVLSPLVVFFGAKLNGKLTILLFLGYVVVNFLFDARSEGVFFFLTSMVLMVKYNKIKLRKDILLISSVFILLISYSGYAFYVSKVLDGEIGGKNAQQLMKAGNPYNPFELLYYGRPDTFVAIEAIGDNPIMGYGSWAKDKDHKYAKLTSLISKTRYIEKDGTPLIRGHSILFQAWLWGGILSFIAILLIFLKNVKMFWFVFKFSENSGILVIIVYLSMAMFWHFFFSPFAHIRQTCPIIFALLLSEYHRLKNII